MKKIKSLLAGAIVAVILAAPLWASPKTVTLNVSGMTCAACPITVHEDRNARARNEPVFRKHAAHPVFVEDVEVARARCPRAWRQGGNVLGAQIPLDGSQTRADPRGFCGGGTTPGKGRSGGEDEHGNDEAGGERESPHEDLRDNCYFTTIFLVTLFPSMTSW